MIDMVEYQAELIHFAAYPVGSGVERGIAQKGPRNAVTLPACSRCVQPRYDDIEWYGPFMGHMWAIYGPYVSQNWYPLAPQILLGFHGFPIKMIKFGWFGPQDASSVDPQKNCFLIVSPQIVANHG